MESEKRWVCLSSITKGWSRVIWASPHYKPQPYQKGKVWVWSSDYRGHMSYGLHRVSNSWMPKTQPHFQGQPIRRTKKEAKTAGFRQRTGVWEKGGLFWTDSCKANPVESNKRILELEMSKMEGLVLRINGLCVFLLLYQNCSSLWNWDSSQKSRI